MGTDERVKVTDTTKTPYNSTAFVAANGAWSTGAVIGKNAILTVAYVINKYQKQS